MRYLRDKDAVIFDLDGVLWDSNAAHAGAFDQLLEEQGIRGVDYRRDLAGMRTDEGFRKAFALAGRAIDDRLVSELTRRKRDLARASLLASRPLRPGSIGAVRYLAKNYRLALATSGSRSSLELFFELSATRSCFELALSGDDVVVAKPDPEIYLSAVRGLGVPVSRVLVVEDAVSGVRAGCAAGATVLGLAGTCEPARLLEAGAVEVVEDLLSALESAGEP